MLLESALPATGLLPNPPGSKQIRDLQSLKETSNSPCKTHKVSKKLRCIPLFHQSSMGTVGVSNQNEEC
jgi:hypothetical protein